MKIKYILPIIFAFLLAACFDDDTTTGTQPISVISIDTTKLEKVYNINPDNYPGDYTNRFFSAFII